MRSIAKLGGAEDWCRPLSPAYLLAWKWSSWLQCASCTCGPIQASAWVSHYPALRACPNYRTSISRIFYSKHRQKKLFVAAAGAMHFIMYLWPTVVTQRDALQSQRSGASAYPHVARQCASDVDLITNQFWRKLLFLITCHQILQTYSLLSIWPIPKMFSKALILLPVVISCLVELCCGEVSK